MVKHSTASVFVFCRLAPGWRVGLIQHPRLAKMMPPGGHVEADEAADEAALREVAEEAGRRVALVPPPAAPVPAGYQGKRVAQPWWIAEYRVQPDNQLASPHVHVDHLYVAVAGSPGQASEPCHPFGWYAAADLPGLAMFEDARLLATSLLAGLAGHQSTGTGAGLVSALLAGIDAAGAPGGVPVSRQPRRSAP
jgi:8-oxo-dGTP pyrophosphatase MutT (NUDIX family)